MFTNLKFVTFAVTVILPEGIVAPSVGDIIVIPGDMLLCIPGVTWFDPLVYACWEGISDPSDV